MAQGQKDKKVKGKKDRRQKVRKTSSQKVVKYLIQFISMRYRDPGELSPKAHEIWLNFVRYPNS